MPMPVEELAKLPQWTPPPDVFDANTDAPRVFQSSEGPYSLPNMPFEWWVGGDGELVPMVISSNHRPPGHDDFSDRTEKIAKATARAANWFPVFGEKPIAEVHAERTRRREAAIAHAAQFAPSRDKVLEAVKDATGHGFDRLVAATEKLIEAADAQRHAALAQAAPPAKGGR
jgi:hypothetical protein